MKVTNMTSSQGNPVPNQFIIEDYNEITNTKGNKILTTTRVFQSYNSVIVKQTAKTGIKDNHGYNVIVRKTYLDKNKWDYSTTTKKYRNQFLSENIAATRKKIKSGEYILTDLN